MSNLNINNLDVQRIINVLNELLLKIDFCSVLTFKTMEKIEFNKEEIIESLNSEEFWKDLNDHFELMCNFKNTHLIIKEEVKEGERNSEIRDEDYIDIEEQLQTQEITREKENLKDIDGKKLMLKF